MKLDAPPFLFDPKKREGLEEAANSDSGAFSDCKEDTLSNRTLRDAKAPLCGSSISRPYRAFIRKG